MRMIRLTDAISAIEDHFKAREEDFWPNEATKRDADLMCQHILERLINAEHVEVDKDDIERLERLGLWKDACKIYVKHHTNQILEDFKAKVEAQNDTRRD